MQQSASQYASTSRSSTFCLSSTALLTLRRFGDSLRHVTQPLHSQWIKLARCCRTYAFQMVILHIVDQLANHHHPGERRSQAGQAFARLFDFLFASSMFLSTWHDRMADLPSQLEACESTRMLPSPVISHNQYRVLGVEGDFGQLGLLDDLLLTQGVMLVLCQVIHMHLHQLTVLGHSLMIHMPLCAAKFLTRQFSVQCSVV